MLTRSQTRYINNALYALYKVEIDFDETAYFNLLHEIIEYFGGESFSYEGDDGAPGYSSNYIIYYAENPLETIKQINSYIIEQLKS